MSHMRSSISPGGKPGKPGKGGVEPGVSVMLFSSQQTEMDQAQSDARFVRSYRA
jgi:hypothetical protein